MEDITIKSITHCPTCNSECKVNGGTTQYYVPVKKYTEREVVIMLQDCAIHFGITNKSKDDGTFTTQIDKWVKNKLK
jgi:hypothetical protein